ncbi:MAG: protein meaA, partial [Rhodospirillales bacterium]|nr:protein meaA [Rhodospirillales bacterium]
YIAAAERQGASRQDLSGTTQNDVLKEYLSRGTYIFPPAPSLKLTADVIAFTYKEVPKWNPTNVCSYHLQEAGATPVQELAYALAIAKAVLDQVHSGGQVPEADLAQVVGRVSFFVNAGIRFITEMCKMRAFSELWDEITEQRYGVDDPKLRRFRYGVQVNSLGLTEQQPENNVYRILLEMLAVTLSKGARARAVQLPAWNEALGLPRPWDQQWSLRLQQIVAYETDLLEYGDIFEGSVEIARKTQALKTAALAELAVIEQMGGAVAAVAYMKQQLVASHAQRIADVESGVQPVVGVNLFTTAEPSPLATGDNAILQLDPKAEQNQIIALQGWRAGRNAQAVATALGALRQAAGEDHNVMEPSIACAHAGVTTGEWAAVLREVYGEYRAPTGVGGAVVQTSAAIGPLRLRVAAVAKKLGRPIKMLVGKPGLDGHSNGAEQIAVRARDIGMEVVYEGIRLTPAEIVSAALEEGVHVLGLSVLSGSHVALVGEILDLMKTMDMDDVLVFVGGIIPQADARALLAAGVVGVFTPKDYDLNVIMDSIVEQIDVRLCAA